MSATGEEDSVVPSIAVGSYESIEGEGITDEELRSLAAVFGLNYRREYLNL